ncbi:MAG: hypothetical protein Q4G35_03240 [Propionibacteriaceae bacterium]|nr:hypothetical protein [Propionibacteriaceae bacterium]
MASLPPTSALRRELGRDWSATDYLLALIFDALAVANWQRQGKKSAPKPPLLPRPGQQDENNRRFGADPIPASRFDDWWEEGGQSDG